MYRTAELVLKQAELLDLPIWQIALDNQVELEGRPEEEMLDEMKKSYEIMRDAATKGLDTELESMSRRIKGNAFHLANHAKGETILGASLVSAMAYAVSVSEVNASMGKIVAAPTAGAAGILPALLYREETEFGRSLDDIAKALVTAAQIGAIVSYNATVSGAAGGCQAECGSAAAMGAAALVELHGGSPAQSFAAAGYALINVMGLVCDPIDGLVEYPCFLRNASGVMNAMSAADLALANVQNLVDFDRVVVAMKQVGDSLPPSLRETGIGGIAGAYCNGCGGCS